MNKIKFNSRIIKSSVPYLGLIIVIALFTILTKGGALSPNNLKLVAEQSLTILISASGVIFVMTLGSLDFSQGSLLAISCYVAASLASTNIVLAIILGILTGVAVGVLNGFLNAKLHIMSFIATICVMFIFRGLTSFLTTNYEPKIPFATLAKMNVFSVKMALLVAMLVGLYIVYRYTKLGHAVRAIGSGEIAAQYSGIKVAQVKIIAFAIAGAMGGVAAIFTLIRTSSITASTGNLLETDVMISLVLGGLPVSGGSRSRFSAVLIGGILMTFLVNGLVQIGAEPVIQQLVKGIVFLVAIIATMDRSSTMVSK
jgi:ribose transport system permease protein